MKISKEAWDFKAENFGPLLPYIQDDNVTDINYNGRDVWIDDLLRGQHKAEIELTQEFVNQFAVRMANVVSANFNQYHNLLEAETDTLRISIIHESAAHTGTSISIRKTPAVRRLGIRKMLQEEYCSKEVLNLLIHCIKGKMNMVFCGLPGSGKTELLKFMTQYIPANEKVMTIEDNLEIHYSEINPGSNCVELKVDEEHFPYTKAIKSSLRQNPQWVLLSEARSVEVKYLLECFSTGLHGLTTIHTDDVRKIPDRVQNMMQDSYAASRLENDVYTFINVGIMIRRRINEKKEIKRYIDQVCFFDRAGEQNHTILIVSDGKIIDKNLPANIKKKFELEGITDPFGEVENGGTGYQKT